MDKVRYRTESYSGLMERDAAEVMAFETFELGNSDILETLSQSIFFHASLGGLLHNFADIIQKKGSESIFKTFELWIEFYKLILKAIEESAGKQIQYALWLADYETVTDFYGNYMSDSDDFDMYEVGPVVLSECGYDGTLYGYESFPSPTE